jgi:site-specific recombinase XerD
VTELNPLVEAFFSNLKRRNKAAHTLERWRPELRRFVEWMGERSLHQITAADLDADFLPWWEDKFRARNRRDPSPNSLRAVIQALRSFYGWLEKFDRLKDPDGVPFRNPAAILETPVIRPAAELDWLRAEEDELLLDAYLKNAREAILVNLFRHTGLRLDEALTLTDDDIDIAGQQIVVRQSKSDAGYRSVPISPELRPHIEAWLAYVKRSGWHAPQGPFLVTRHGTAMKAQYVEDALARIGERVGLRRKLKPHTLRRTFGSHLLNKGVRLEVVSKLLGHANTAITERAYARLEDQTIRDEMMRALRG